ncbi:MAG TPA: hypothetical protein VK001_00175 [Geminicoccaceae bacterium]|nr:hypothetical protein [Geminicoccaceae bacterium]
MHRRLVSGLGLAVVAGLVGACEEPEISKLTYAEVSEAAKGKDAAAFRSYFADLRGQRVAWSGRVVDARTEHGDEFAELGILEVDLDGAAPEEDAILQVSVSTAREATPGQEVRFTGIIREFEWTNRRPVLRLEVREIE